ncbi:hypothetical protein HNY73_006814 [Argiope bruennichi]|uniref:Uncharacterized protein n=1 Tax=Argiope bruennichi TaxID=94029 RepID=A0A8T0FH59_ARGBR|nr:hypothetical protein HNY73_006814 [Argiope bruennichi]
MVSSITCNTIERLVAQLTEITVTLVIMLPNSHVAKAMNSLRRSEDLPVQNSFNLNLQNLALIFQFIEDNLEEEDLPLNDEELSQEDWEMS